MTARIEIPSDDSVVGVSVVSTGHVSDVVVSAEVDMSKVSRITYNGLNPRFFKICDFKKNLVSGIEVSVSDSLESIYFRDGSAFVVYLKSPCPSHSRTPTPSPSPSASSSPFVLIVPIAPIISEPLPHIPKKRKTGAGDIYRHCSTYCGPLKFHKYIT